MATGNVKLVLDIDARPMTSAMRDMQDRIAAAAAITARERAAALERMHRRHLDGAADVLEALSRSRRRFDPRRITDRAHARACRRLVATSRNAGA
jgi:hypothetical protein